MINTKKIITEFLDKNNIKVLHGVCIMVERGKK